MLRIERKNEILALLDRQGSVLVADLARYFGVSDQTVRRDLEELTADGLAAKTYGGAVAPDSMNDPSFRAREKTHQAQKDAIARKVCALVADGERIALDASSTAVLIAKHLRGKRGLTILTNSVEILMEYGNRGGGAGTEVLSTGGNLRANSLSLTGGGAVRALERYTVDHTIISCKGVDMETGMWESSEAEAEVKQAMLRAGREVILAADLSKLDRRSFVRIAYFDRIHALVTERAPSEEWRTFLNDRGVRVV